MSVKWQRPIARPPHASGGIHGKDATARRHRSESGRHLDEIKDEVPEQGRTNAKALQKIEDGVTRAADAVEEAVESATDGDS